MLPSDGAREIERHCVVSVVVELTRARLWRLETQNVVPFAAQLLLPASEIISGEALRHEVFGLGALQTPFVVCGSALSCDAKHCNFPKQIIDQAVSCFCYYCIYSQNFTNAGNGAASLPVNPHVEAAFNLRTIQDTI